MAMHHNDACTEKGMRGYLRHVWRDPQVSPACHLEHSLHNSSQIKKKPNNKTTTLPPSSPRSQVTQAAFEASCITLFLFTIKVQGLINSGFHP